MNPEPGETYTPIDVNEIIGFTSIPKSSARGQICALLMPTYEPETDLLWTEPLVDDPLTTNIDESTYAPRETWTNRPFLVNIGGNRVALLSQVLWFNATASQGDADLLPTVASWNFGDGNTATGLLVSHSYTVAGQYNVTCTINGTTTTRYVRVLNNLGESDLDVISVDSFGASTEGWKVTLKIRDNTTIENFQGILLYAYDDMDISWRSFYETAARELARNTSYGSDLPPDAIWYDTANGNKTIGNTAIGRVGSPTGGCWDNLNQYNDIFERASNAHSVPANLLKAIGYIKSCGQTSAVYNTLNDLCPESIGIMQVPCGGTEQYEPEVSITSAAEILARHYKTCGTWEGAINYYVGNHCICDDTVDYYGNPDCSYVESIISYWREADNSAGIGGGYDGPLYGEVIFNGYITDVITDKDSDTSIRTVVCDNTASVLGLLTKRKEIFFENARLASAGGTVLSQPMRTATCIHHILSEHTDFPNYHDVILDWSGPRFSSTTANEGSLWSNLTEWARNDFSDVWGDRNGILRYSLKPQYRGKIWYDQTQALWIDPSLLLEVQVTERHAEKISWVKLAGMLAGGTCEIYGEFPCGGPPKDSTGKWVIQRGFQYDDWRVLCAMAAHEYAYQNRRYDVQFTLPWRHDLEIQDIIVLPIVDKSGRFNWSSIRPKFVITSISHQYSTEKASWITSITAEELTYGVPCGCPRPHCPNTDIPTDIPNIPELPGGGYPPLPGGDCWGVCDQDNGSCSGDTNETMKWYQYTGQYKDGHYSYIEGDPTDHYTSVRSGDYCSGRTYDWSTYVVGGSVTVATDAALGPPDGFSDTSTMGYLQHLTDTDPFVVNRSAEGGEKPKTTLVTFTEDLTETTVEMNTSTLTASTSFVHTTDNTDGELFEIEDVSTWVEITVYSPEGLSRIGELWIRKIGDFDGSFLLVAQEVKTHHDPPSGIDDPTADLVGTSNLFGLSQEYSSKLNNPLRKEDSFILKRLNGYENTTAEGRSVFGGQNNTEINHDDGSWTKMSFSLPGSPAGKTYRVGLITDQSTSETTEDSTCEQTFVCLERRQMKDFCCRSAAYAESTEDKYYPRETVPCGVDPADYCFHRSVEIPHKYISNGTGWPDGTKAINSWTLEDTWPGTIVPHDTVFVSGTGGYYDTSISVYDGYRDADRRLKKLGVPFEVFGTTRPGPIIYSTVPYFNVAPTWSSFDLFNEITTCANNPGVTIRHSLMFSLADYAMNQIFTQSAEMSGSYQMMIAWTSCGINNPAGPWVGPGVPVPDGQNLPGTCTNWPSATTINNLIEKAQKENGRTGILSGLGEEFINSGQQYGINPGFVAAIALLATKFGTDGSEAINRANNPFLLNGTGDCGTYGNLARYCNGTKAIRGCFELLDGSIFRSTDGTLNEIIAHFFSPYPESWDQLAIAAGQLGITLNYDTQLYTVDPMCLDGSLNAPPAGTMGGFNTALEYSLHSAGGNISQGPFGIWSHSVCDCYDFSVPEGTPIYSVTSGTVVESQATAGVYEPNTIVVETEFGNIRYAHLTQRNVTVGDTVTNTTLLGYSGTAGTGPHLHLGLDGGSGASPKGYSLTQILQAVGFNLGGFTWTG